MAQDYVQIFRLSRVAQKLVKNHLTQLVIGAVFFQVLLILVGSYFSLNIGERWLRNDFSKRSQSTTNYLGGLAAPFVCRGDWVGLKNYLDNFLTGEDIAYLKIRTDEKEVFQILTHSGAARPKEISSEAFEETKIFSTFGSVEICKESKIHEAEIEVGFWFSRINEPLNLSKTIVVLGSVIQFGSILLIFFFLTRFIQKRLGLIKEKCAEVAIGNFDSHLNLGTGNEFSQIAESINSMSTSLKILNKETEENRRQLLQQAKFTSIGEMAAGIAHEVNNPLAIVSGRIELVQKNLKSVNPDLPKAVETLGKTFEAVHRASQIIRGLKILSRNEEHDPLVATLVESVVSDALSLSTEKIRNNGMDVSVNLVPEAKIMCRPGQLSQVLINLIHNACDANETNSEKWIKIESQIVKDRIHLSITDSGHGIAPKVAEKLMEPFFTTKPVGRGTGLGLSIARGIIVGHNGELIYDASSPRTRFKINLPLASQQTDSSKAA